MALLPGEQIACISGRFRSAGTPEALLQSAEASAGKVRIRPLEPRRKGRDPRLFARGKPDPEILDAEGRADLVAHERREASP